MPTGVSPAVGGYYCSEGLPRCCVGSDGIFITIICSSFLPAGCALRSFASHLTKWKSSWKCFMLLLLLQWKLLHSGVLPCALCLTFLPDTYQVGTFVPWVYNKNWVPDIWWCADSSQWPLQVLQRERKSFFNWLTGRL